MKIGIRRKLLRFVISGSVMSFAVYLLLMGFGLWQNWRVINDNSREIAGQTGQLTLEFTLSEELKRLQEMARVRAEVLNDGLMQYHEDADYLSRQITALLQCPTCHKERTLPRVDQQDIPAGTPFVRMSRELLTDPQAFEQVRPQLSLLANMAKTMQTYYKYYPRIFIGTEGGYALVMYNIPFEKRPLDKVAYDPRQRPWYQLAKNAGHSVFTTLYRASAGDLCISTATPFYAPDGAFMGVVGFDISMEDYNAVFKKIAFYDDEQTFVVNEDAEIIFSNLTSQSVTQASGRRNLKDFDSPGIADLLTLMRTGSSGVMSLELDGRQRYVAYAPIGKVGWNVGVVLDVQTLKAPSLYAASTMKNLVADLDLALLRLFRSDMLKAALLLPAVVLLVYFLSVALSNALVRPLEKLNALVREVAAGRLEQRIELKTGDEIEELAQSFNHMTVQLKEQMDELRDITAEKERIETELAVATAIQGSMLPHQFPPPGGAYELYALSEPAREMGGDFYDFYLLDPEHLVLTMADVSGKGVPAALFMVIAKVILKNNMKAAGRAQDLAQVMTLSNMQLLQNNKEELFVTVFMAVLNLKSGVLDYVCAGHNPPLIGHGPQPGRDLGQREDHGEGQNVGTSQGQLPQGSTDAPDAADAANSAAGGPPNEPGAFRFMSAEHNLPMLGVIEDLNFKQYQIRLMRGDKLFMYTDGVNEAMNAQGAQFGNLRLEQALNAALGLNSEGLCERVLEAVRSYAAGAEQSDDITLLALRYTDGTRDIQGSQSGGRAVC